MKDKIILKSKAKYILYEGDCLNLIKNIPDNSIDLVVTSPPYCMGKEYDKSCEVDYFINLHEKIFPDVVRVLKPGGSLCWQIGYYVNNGDVIPLDYLIYDLLKEQKELFLKNRIIWHYGHGFHSSKRFSGRHEVVLWFTKGKDSYKFNLDNVRVPQKYPGKTYYKGKRKGEFSGNPLGKNPADIWEIPNVNANHMEKTEHPCQFPVALIQRLVLALTNKGDIVLDPFMGSGSAGIATIVEGRRFIGFDNDKKYYKIAKKRCEESVAGKIKFRAYDKPIMEPNQKMAVARKPASFK